MDGNTLFFPPNSLLLFLTLGSGSSLQQSGAMAGKTARSTEVGLSSKDAAQRSKSICLSAHHVPAGMQSEQSPERKMDEVQF